MAEFQMTVPKSYDTTGVEHFIVRDFEFYHGGKQDVHVAFRQFNPSKTKVVLVPTCYGGRINDTCNYAEGALADRRVVVMAMLGNGESSSPSNTKDFPTKLDYRDVVRAHHAVLTQHLGVKHLETVIGFSMGGQQAYYWTKCFPEYISSAVSICSSARTSEHNLAFLEGPATALLHSIDYPDYEKNSATVPVRGLAAFGRAWVAWVLSAAWFREGHWRNMAPTMDGFLTNVADNLFSDWDPNNLLVLLRMWQRADIGSFAGSGGDQGSLEKALADIPVPVLVMPCRTDAYFDWHDSEIEVKHLGKNSRLEIIESVWGHAAGGSLNPEDVKWVDGRIAEWLKTHGGN